MNTPTTSSRPPRRLAAAIAVSCLLALAPLSAAAAPARARQKKPRLTPARIEVVQKDPAAVLRPGTGVTFSARMYSRNGTLIEGGVVKWVTDESEDVVATQPLDSGSTHEVTLIGFNREGRTPKPGVVRLTASLPNGALPVIVQVPFRPNLNVDVKPAAGQPAKIGPGDKYTLNATVSDEVGEVAGAKVKWELAESAEMGKFVLLNVDGQNPNRVTAIGLTPPKGEAPSAGIVVVAAYGGVPKFATIPYRTDGRADAPDGPPAKSKTAKVKDIAVTGKDGKTFASGHIEPGQRLTLKAEAKKADLKDASELPDVVWEVPEEMERYIAMLEPAEEQKEKGKKDVVLYGLTPEAGEADAEPPESLYVLVRAGDYVEAVPIRNGEQTVDVSWIVLPTDVVTKNFGRSISDKYYGIQVVVGNNSGHDLQLTGLSFEVHQSLLYQTNDATLRRMPVASYDVVRGVTEQRKLSLKSRGTIIAGLDAAAQILTGFTPFFNVATRARNFSHGINILSNPVTKGIERVWPDPLQDEMNRLEQQSLHDDKIIHNRDVYRTTVFFPRDVLSCAANGTPVVVQNEQPCTPLNSPDNLVEVRRRLGELILVGRKLDRNDFQFRVRQGLRAAPAGL